MTRRSAFITSHTSLTSYEGYDYPASATEIAKELLIDAHSMVAHEPSSDLLARCRQSVRDSEVLILILGWRYGALHDGRRSLTEIEYDTAVETDKEVIVLLHTVDAPPNLDPDEAARAKAFRARFNRPGDRPLYGEFTDPASFAKSLRNALLRVLTSDQLHGLTRNSHEVLDAIRMQLPSLRALDRLRVPRAAILTSRELDPLLATTPPYLRDLAGIEEPQGEVTVRTRVDPADSCFPQHIRLIVTGEFGSGKTDVIERLYLTACARAVEMPSSARAPLRLNLEDWDTTSLSFASLVRREAERRFGNRVVSNDLCLLLDGIDNLADPLQAADTAQIIQWFASHRRAWAAIALRQLDGFGSQLINASVGFVLLTLEGLEPRTAIDFIERNTGRGPSQDAILSFVSKALAQDDDHLNRILQSPFTLKILCAFSQGTKPLPSNSALLLRVYVQAAFHKEAGWSSTNRLDHFVTYVGALAMRSLLGRDANHEIAPNSTHLAMPNRSFYKQLACTLDIFSVGTSNYRVRAWTGRFLTYFAAEYLLMNRESLAQLLPFPTYRNGRRSARRLDASIHDLIQLDNTAIEPIARQDACLAAACFHDITIDRQQDATDIIVDQLVELLNSDDNEVRLAANGALVSLGEAALPPLASAMKRAEHWLRRRLIESLRQFGDRKSVELIVNALTDRNKWVAAEAELAVLAFDQPRQRYVTEFIQALGSGMGSTDDEAVLRYLGTLSADYAAAVNSILGIEDEPRIAIPKEEHETATEVPDASGTTGFDLANQLRAVQGDPVSVERGRAWLSRAQVHDKAWAQVWTALWDRVPGDSSLVALGRSWLEAVPDTAGPWGHVWIRLTRAYLSDAMLISQGRSWLKSVRPTHVAWPHVWHMLSEVMSGDLELLESGRKWLLRIGEPGRNWGIVWLRLHDLGRYTDELERIGSDLLVATSMDDMSWGRVWPKLFEANSGNELLYELGRGWLTEAPLSHPGWGYVWPLVWKAQPEDPDVESVGRDWLDLTSPVHGGWPFVWEPLWAAHPSDDALLKAAYQWLNQASPAHEGWARVWAAVWTTRSGDQQLQYLGREWLDHAPTAHKGWPFVFAPLLNHQQSDHGLIDRGQRWLRDVSPSHPGWAHIWRTLWECGLKTPEMVAVARKWLDEDGVAHNGFSTVWELLWSNTPDDALRRLALDRLWKHPDDSTLMYMWQQLSHPLTKDESLTQWGIAFLRSRVCHDHPHWNAIWSDLYTRSSGNPEVHELGAAWLSSHDASAPGWRNVWQHLWDACPGDSRLVTVGIHALENPSVDLSSWKTTWRSIFPLHGKDARLISATLRWLRTPASRVFRELWLEVARVLNQGGHLEDDLLQELGAFEADSVADLESTREECQKLECAFSLTSSWIHQWQTAWTRPIMRPMLVASGIRWLNEALQTTPRAWPYVWHKLYLFKLDNARVAEVGSRWLRIKDSTTGGWGLVWGAVVRTRSTDVELVRQGTAWLEARHLDRTTWPEVWSALWDLNLADRANLITSALSWLSHPNKTRIGYAAIWCRLWDTPNDSAHLRDLGIEFAKLASSHDGWIDVVLRLGSRGAATVEIHERVAQWFAQNLVHPSATIVAQVFSLTTNQPPTAC